MKKCLLMAFLTVVAVVPLLAKVHKDSYPMSCGELWNAVQDTVKNSGYYTPIVLDEAQMTAAFNISGAIHSRTISAHLEPQGSSCEMQTQTSFSGLMQNDAGDFKSRVEQSLAKLKASPASTPQKPGAPGK